MVGGLSQLISGRNGGVKEPGEWLCRTLLPNAVVPMKWLACCNFVAQGRTERRRWDGEMGAAVAN
jgi:hypothetical protein